MSKQTILLGAAPNDGAGDAARIGGDKINDNFTELYGRNIYPEDYGAVGDGTTDDTTSIQAAINAAVTAQGSVMLRAVTYKITAALSITGACSILGVGAHPLNGSAASEIEAVNMPRISPYLKGSVILQSTAATNAITITATGRGVSLRNFGIRFADAIKFANTGHGVIYQATVTTSTFRDQGLSSALWENVLVYGHDGNHYAFWLTNPICWTANHLQGWGGGGMCVEQNSNLTYFGNGAVTHSYFALCVAGTAHGYHLKQTGDATHVLNLMNFFGCQCNGANTGVASPPTSAQYTFKVDHDVRFVSLYACDFETGTELCPVDFNLAGNKGCTVWGCGILGISDQFYDPGNYTNNRTVVGDPAGNRVEVHPGGFKSNTAIYFIDTASGSTMANIGLGGITPRSMADSAAGNGTIYYSTTASKLVFKDSGGVVNSLY